MTIGRPYMPMNPNMQFVGGEARVNENMVTNIFNIFLFFLIIEAHKG